MSNRTGIVVSIAEDGQIVHGPKPSRNSLLRDKLVRDGSSWRWVSADERGLVTTNVESGALGPGLKCGDSSVPVDPYWGQLSGGTVESPHCGLSRPRGADEVRVANEGGKVTGLGARVFDTTKIPILVGSRFKVRVGVITTLDETQESPTWVRVRHADVDVIAGASPIRLEGHKEGICDGRIVSELSTSIHQVLANIAEEVTVGGIVYFDNSSVGDFHRRRRGGTANGSAATHARGVDRKTPAKELGVRQATSGTRRKVNEVASRRL
jgi:hypothetical protein